MLLSFIGCNAKNNKSQLVNDNANIVTVDKLSDKNDDAVEKTISNKEQMFTTVDLDGNQIDNSIFDGYVLTIVNYRAVYCPYCIEELPDLNDWAKELSDICKSLHLFLFIASRESFSS